MNRLFLVITVILAISTTGAHSAINQGGSTNTSFSCDVNTMQCKCAGILEGADCKAMIKNCSKPLDVECNELVAEPWCSCRMAKQVSNEPKIQRAPAAPARQ